jgi:hypothetical protein
MIEFAVDDGEDGDVGGASTDLPAAGPRVRRGARIAVDIVPAWAGTGA